MKLQVTRFKYGGFALGLIINHCVSDGKSAMEFVCSWAETARGLPLSTPPVIDNSMFMSNKLSPQVKNPTEKFNIVEISDVSTWKASTKRRTWCTNHSALIPTSWQS